VRIVSVVLVRIAKQPPAPGSREAGVGSPLDDRRRAANRLVVSCVCLDMNRRLPLPPGLGRFLNEYGLAVGIAIGAVIGLIFGNVAIAVVAGIPLGLGPAS
jgi:hypothetical protein